MKSKTIFTCITLFFSLIAFCSFSCRQTNDQPTGKEGQAGLTQIPHLEKQGTASRLVVKGKPMLLFSGELHNSTCGGFESMRTVWKGLSAKNLNSVIATVSWELIEPEEGKFNFNLVDSMIMGARQAKLKLVLIWFGSWKNSGSVYIPSWVKKNFVKYPRVKDAQGKPLEILSTFGEASAAADSRAFAAFMRHIREVDEKDQTVVMIQVENEMGILDNTGKAAGNACRDFCEPATKEFRSAVPGELTAYLVKTRENLFPELLKVWKANGSKLKGNWEEVFGKSFLKTDKKDWELYSCYTEELFMAWNYARYVEKVASAGKKEYPLPMYVNAWLKQPSTSWPGRYPSGGPLPQVLDIWKAAAPSIDFISPDIYIDQFTWVCREFTRGGNPLFIPETRGGEIGAARAFYAFGEHSASCFAPFGIDDEIGLKNDPLAQSYSILQIIMPLLIKKQGKEEMHGILVDRLNPANQFDLGKYRIEAKLAWNARQDVAGGLIIQTGTDEFVVAGKSLDIYFLPMDTSMRIGVDVADEGYFEAGNWKSLKRLNGDETHASTWDGTGAKLPDDKFSIQKISFYRYR